MNALQKVVHRIQAIKLPLVYGSHRQIMDADRNVVLEVFSGGSGIEAADQLQELVVVACNSFSLLVSALRAAENLSNIGLLNAPEGEIEHVDILRRAALTAAGAA